jgi:hypothetical protein
MANTYEWNDGTRIKLDAQVAGETLEKLIEENDGMLTPQTIMDAAQDPHSPLHTAFTWDDGVAAFKYRMNEARYLTRSLLVVYRNEQGDERRVRGFVSLETQSQAIVPVTVSAIAAEPGERRFTFTAAISPEDGEPGDEARRGYVHIFDAMQDEALRKQIMEIAKREIISWRKRYGEYQEFAQVVTTIDELAQMKLDLPA